MGGDGSGTWHRSKKKDLTDSRYEIDIRWLKKRGHLRIGATRILYWTRLNGESGSIEYRVEEDGLVLDVRNPQARNFMQEISFARIPCRFGGMRLFFVCPKCARRVAVLYGMSEYLCRHCHKLGYASQREKRGFRKLRKVQRIWERLGGDLSSPVTVKPKWMHHKTYERLSTEARSAESWFLAYFTAFHQSISGKNGSY
jgi:hypothetical protein